MEIFKVLFSSSLEGGIQRHLYTAELLYMEHHFVCYAQDKRPPKCEGGGVGYYKRAWDESVSRCYTVNISFDANNLCEICPEFIISPFGLAFSCFTPTHQ